ncbi:STM3941 family protein [Paenibacillus donghaensis]|uniref:Uncharacterized protein n=1 Tax=Paenibacillus donghaensis TaxID=414771 RepID=A0A2Z2KGH5_9BACL|nr:STM3941 family protein [Paenibacillus donghaensis]ASA25856.1 hypothetical protein B9T62_37100 [Paenibacillus donghaensis]
MSEAVFSEPLKIYLSKSKLWLMVLGSLIFVALGVWLIKLYVRGAVTFLHAGLGVISILFFGACLLFVVVKLFDRAPAVILDQRGITDQSSFAAGGFIGWDDIEDIQLYQLSGQTMIGIQLKDPALYLKQQYGSKGRLMRINQGMVQSPVNIAQTSLNLPLALLYEEIMLRWELHQSVKP